MTKGEYINVLSRKGYRQINENQVSLGTLIFDITETANHTAMGDQSGYCLHLNADCDMNLCPNPYQK